MKYAEDFRAIAREALRGKWPTAVLTGFIASLMGACIATAGGGNSNSSNRNSSTKAIIQDFQVTQFWEKFGTLIMIGIVVLVVWLIVTLIIGGAGKLGYATFNLTLVDHKAASLSNLFSQFHRLWDGFCMNFLMGLYTILWSLLFVIPGLIKQYSYAMTPYILAEHPEMTANEAITRSREIMDGNKWRLFCLGFSFIGWSLLCSLPTLIALGAILGMAYRGQSLAVLLWLIPAGIPSFIGYLFLRPYQEAAYAAFYRDVSGTETYTVLLDSEDDYTV